MRLIRHRDGRESEMAIETREMYASHDCLRKEIGALPLRVKATTEGDDARAGFVGDHVLLMMMMLEHHHEAEDVKLWPLLEERLPDRVDLFHELESQHQQLHPLIDAARMETSAWMTDPTAHNRAALHTTLIRLEKLLLPHLGQEEAEILPLVQDAFTQDEFNAIGDYARTGVPPEQMAIVLGMILDDTTADVRELVWNALPAEAQQGFDQFGRPAYAAYRDRLVND